jgi:hypothetical protein
VEILEVLTGMPVDEPARQTTAVLDVIQAAISATQQYPRVSIGHVIDLAVSELAADDAIRILTELIDNATNFSPPHTQVTVSAHVTDTGAVLIRVEDTGIGIRPEKLAHLNRLLAGTGIPQIDEKQAAHLGLLVATRLVIQQPHLHVRLIPRHPTGITATLLLDGDLLCEPPQAAAGPPAANGLLDDYASPSAGPQPRSSHLLPVDLGADLPPASPGPGLPRRMPGSVRRDHVAPQPAQTSQNASPAWADVDDFNAGIDTPRPL